MAKKSIPADETAIEESAIETTETAIEESAIETTETKINYSPNAGSNAGGNGHQSIQE